MKEKVWNWFDTFLYPKSDITRLEEPDISKALQIRKIKQDRTVQDRTGPKWPIGLDFWENRQYNDNKKKDIQGCASQKLRSLKNTCSCIWSWNDRWRNLFSLVCIRFQIICSWMQLALFAQNRVPTHFLISNDG